MDAVNKAYEAKWNKDHEVEYANYDALNAVREETDQADYMKEQCRLSEGVTNFAQEAQPCERYQALLATIKAKGVCFGPNSEPEGNKRWVRCVNM